MSLYTFLACYYIKFIKTNTSSSEILILLILIYCCLYIWQSNAILNFSEKRNQNYCSFMYNLGFNVIHLNELTELIGIFWSVISHTFLINHTIYRFTNYATIYVNILNTEETFIRHLIFITIINNMV